MENMKIIGICNEKFNSLSQNRTYSLEESIYYLNVFYSYYIIL